ncbi:hypothetical protein DL95DRAFT_166214 [Leptodontidium sp. 2 PMI_412]|nr:hypothetical protein DL95DRAFT_166214 [Leptodontidium sp. 2 PMI_412]
MRCFCTAHGMDRSGSWDSGCFSDSPLQCGSPLAHEPLPRIWFGYIALSIPLLSSYSVRIVVTFLSSPYIRFLSFCRFHLRFWPIFMHGIALFSLDDSLPETRRS